jgi:putative component of membrane protein insertase Oxa1/YidC/SpoIIIJ protein YidD
MEKLQSVSQIRLIDFLVVHLIIFYQKIISPFKGFSCAYRYQQGGSSCSEFVKQIVQQKGFVSGFSDIRARFHDCKLAAIEIHNSNRRKEAGVLDCGLDGCGDVGSCFDGVGGGGAGAGTGSGASIVIVLPVGIIILLLIFGGSIWLKGPQVSSIEIRLIEKQLEVQEKGVARLLGGKQPDYQVIFTVEGRKIATNTLINSTAKTWLKLEPKSRFRAVDIERITIVNKQVLKDEILEVIDGPGESGKGEIYEYRIF